MPQLVTQLLGSYGSGTAANSLTTNAASSLGSTADASTATTSGGSTAGATGGSTTNPNLPSWYSSFLQNIPQQASQLSYQASQPVIGQQQIANNTAQVGQNYNNAAKQVTSQLGKAGALNSGRAAQTLTGLAVGKANQLSNYNANVPLINQQNSLNYGSQLLGQQMGFTSPIGAFGSTQSNFNNAFQNYFGTNSANNTATSTNTSGSTTGNRSNNQNSGSGPLGVF